ncbi:nucleotidyl transferase AbiEii/AbiGii toxin family protein [Campylobacter ureolyticus]|uniref:nucleotidyl transferase AbiEii/AbiGii toxin family protein n=1 Tax=Campylobacter ureolyticus TaxID=827 RepID=UPI0022B5349A|nr:nucleotidyl transferase AbiEii/AbiGii toxin family protein [Campylobacter ureolyticus]MCZ6164204.1 nucleotidyl transferase AbiEii/AbiGii toxin family protein [Campylobacter ureolyticus]MCZ6166069.1 nucleotidyl transferase AbiEii/AbiGii toxin family protein [Campylobacter ureolyticus]
MELLDKYKALYNAQDKILDLLAKSGVGLYLTGGTALNRFILNNYRYSDDLDLFTVEQSVSARAEINDFVSFLKENGVKFDILVDSFGFKRLITDENLKIDLVYDSTKHIGKFIEKNGFLVDNIENIFINKLDATYSRDEIRDYFDLYLILKNFDINLYEGYKNLQLKSATTLEEICANMMSFTKLDITKINIHNLPVKSNKILNDFKENSQSFFKNYFSLENIKSEYSNTNSLKDDLKQLKNLSSDFNKIFEDDKEQTTKNRSNISKNRQ